MAHKILAVDDHPETLSILVTTLKGHGYHVVFTRSPFKGLQLAESEKPDLLLVDMNMPEMNGIELVRRVRAAPQGDKLPIIMFTAEVDIATKMAGFQAGVDDYIMKPTEPMELIERVASLLKHVPDPDPNNKLKQIDTNNNVVAKIKPPEPPPPAVAEGQLIALCGVRGGVGTTTTAINLACILALTKHPTTLVDFDLRQGHIGIYLNQKMTHGLNQINNMSVSRIHQEVARQRIAYRNNLHLLLAQPNINGIRPIPTTNEINTILEALLKPGQHVVVDLGGAGNTAVQPVLDRADHLIVCLSPERVALAAAKRYLDDMSASLFLHTKLHILVCDMQMGASLPRESMEKYLKHHLLSTVPIRYRELVMASNQGIPLIQAFPKSPTLATLYKVSLELIPAKK